MIKLWNIVKFSIFFLLIISLYFYFSAFSNKFIDVVDQNSSINQDSIVDDFKTDDSIIKQGRIKITNLDTVTKLPIKNSEFRIIDLESGETVQELTSDLEGIATTSLMDFDTNYTIEQISVPIPYKLVNTVIELRINEDSNEIVLENELLSYIKEIKKNDDGTLEIIKVNIPVDTLIQNPELPNGCEITSLTAVMNSNGYEITKIQMAYDYLSMLPFYRKNGKLYGANPYEAFAGDPAHSSGFFVYAPPIVEAANHYFDHVGTKDKAVDISGYTKEEIIQYLDKGTPVIIWVTLELNEPKFNYSWHVEGTEEEILAPVNLHAVVLNGYDENNVYVMNPLKGHLTHNIDTFFESYEKLGKHAVVIIKDNIK